MKPPSVQLLRALRSTGCTRLDIKLPMQIRSRCDTSSRAANFCQAHAAAKNRIQLRTFTTAVASQSSRVPDSSDRGPPSKEDTQTDFGTMNVLGNTPVPTTAIDACLSDGFHLDSGLKIGSGSGCLLVAGEAFSWRPWEAGERGSGTGKGRMINKKGQWDIEKEAWGLLDLVWPKPDLLILGLGPSTHPISPDVRKYINSLGIRVDIQDTRNAAAQFNLLATERGVSSIAAAMIPMGWKEPEW